MSPRSRYSLIALSCFLILAFGSVAAGQDSFDALRARYARVQSVHLVSAASVSRRKAGSEKLLSGSMRFEYWANGSGYRMKCASDPELQLVSDMELANDGSQWQLLQIAKRELVLSGIWSAPLFSRHVSLCIAGHETPLAKEIQERSGERFRCNPGTTRGAA